MDEPQHIDKLAVELAATVLAVRLVRPFDRALLETALAGAGMQLVALAHPGQPRP